MVSFIIFFFPFRILVTDFENSLSIITIIKITFFILIIFMYLFIGYKMNLKQQKKYDLLSVSLPSIIGTLIWLITFISYSKSLTVIPQHLSEFWIYVNGFNSAFTIVMINFNISLTSPTLILVLMQLPSLLMWCGFKVKRYPSILLMYSKLK